MAKPWRPDMNDVDRLSKGDGAKKRGTGNYNIPHRLNSDERPVYEAAKKKGYLQVRGTGYRKGAGGRKGNPLPNVYRQWCDAKATACIVIEQDMTGASGDVVVVDLAPLRATDLSAAVQLCGRLAAAAGARQLPLQERSLDAVPFNILPVELPVAPQKMLYPDSAGAAATAAATPEQLQSAEMAVLQQADVVRQLKAGGMGNSSPEVQQQVQELLSNWGGSV
ncbi:hypothetical protein OEZ85_011838 [Tetradesmus obliquus]|uniref:Uncharacterized protein n=1 Tax=Tetradesmus obliquus TaxID=3088 RepID=A0ABY8TRI1_TETOB|nr:hypothetical protein OEZ85_011838 [Tetradesmus obliquus]